ncbi:MAG: MarR family transcriptional regulator [Crocinitomicaceae bacterium]|nr:MarR family transcriptional regulator [Crocinitomicaceae bacterium]
MKIEDELKSKFSSEYHKLLVNIHLTSSRLGERMESEMKKHDLTATQYNVLRILRGQHKRPASIGLIKDRMIERNSDVSRIIDRLVKKELIERTENQTDRRQKDVVISDKGLKVLAAIDNLENRIMDQLGHLSEQEVDTLNNLLDKARSKDDYL